MNRIEFERRLDEAITARDAEELQRLQSLASQDGECRAVWVEYEAFRHAISCWIASVPEVDLAEGVLARLESPAGQMDDSLTDAAGADVRVAVNGAELGKSHRIRRAAISLAVVASLLCVLIPSLWRVGGPSQRPGEGGTVPPEVVERVRPSDDVTAGSAEHLTAEFAVPSGDGLLLQASRVPSSLARRAANSFSGALVLVPDVAEIDSRGDDRGDADSVLGRLGRNLEPIGRDVSKSLGFLWDTLPMDSAPST